MKRSFITFSFIIVFLQTSVVKSSLLTLPREVQLEILKKTEGQEAIKMITQLRQINKNFNDKFKKNADFKKLLREKYAEYAHQNGYSPLSWAVKQNNTELVKLYLDVLPASEKNKIENINNVLITPLIQAISDINTPMIKILLSDPHVNVNTRHDPRGEKNTPHPLHKAIDYTQLDFDPEKKAAYLEIITLLLKHPNLNPNILRPDSLSVKETGLTPLMKAARYGDEKLTELLLRHPLTDVAKKDAKKRNALIHARLNNHNTVAVKILTEMKKPKKRTKPKRKNKSR